MTIVKKVNITSAQILALFTTPIQILAAPLAGTVNNILSISMSYHWVAASYVGAGNYEIQIVDAINFKAYKSGFNIAVADSITQACNKDLHDNMIASVTSDLRITAPLNPTVGGGNLDVYITYQNITIS